MSLKNKKILITAGPTRVPIDAVRAITNFATGETGILLAERLNKSGARVTLLSGSAGRRSLNKKIRMVRFCSFRELESRLKQELVSRRYDAVIQAAAVADYQPRRIWRNKIRSGINRLRLELKPTPKLINYLKRFSSHSLAVGFKFEPQASKEKIIREARALMRAARLDLVVANTVTQNRYRAYVVAPDKVRGAFNSKPEMARSLVHLIRVRLCRN